MRRSTARTITVNVDETTNLRDRQPINVSLDGRAPDRWCGQRSELGHGGEPRVPGRPARVPGRRLDLGAPGQAADGPRRAGRRRRASASSLVRHHVPAVPRRPLRAPADRAQAASASRRTRSRRSAALGGDQSTGCRSWQPTAPSTTAARAGAPALAARGERARSSARRRNTTYAQHRPRGRRGGEVHREHRDTNASLGCSATVPCALVAVPVMGISCDAARGLPAADRPTGRRASASLRRRPCARARATTTRSDSAADRLRHRGPGGVGAALVDRVELAQPDHRPADVRPDGEHLRPGQHLRTDPDLRLAGDAAGDACSGRRPSAPNPKLFKFQHVQTGEPQAKNLVDTGNVEAALAGAPPSTPFTKPIVQAPIAVSGFAIAFNIDDANGHPVAHAQAHASTARQADDAVVRVEPDDLRRVRGVLKGNPLDLGQRPGVSRRSTPARSTWATTSSRPRCCSRCRATPTCCAR